MAIKMNEAVQPPPGALWSSGCKSQALMRLSVSQIVIHQGCAVNALAYLLNVLKMD